MVASVNKIKDTGCAATPHVTGFVNLPMFPGAVITMIDAMIDAHPNNTTRDISDSFLVHRSPRFAGDYLP